MLVSIAEEPVSSQSWRKKKLHMLRCDLFGCENIWRVPFRGNRSEDKLDFCCADHKYASRRSGELFDKKLKDRSMKKWGVASPNCLKETKRKIAESKERKWGDKNYNNRFKSERTCQEKLGCKNPFQSDAVKEKIRTSLIENWGVTSPIRSPEIKRRIEESLIHNYGVRHAWNVPEHRARNRSKEIREKIHQTMKVRDRYGKSQIEDRMYKDLCEAFGFDSVERQATLNGWNIDFKVMDTYIQLDGEYWHGLNRPLAEIMSSENARDKIILGTFFRDAKQNEWCDSTGILMIRITDTEYMRAGIKSVMDRMGCEYV